MEGKKYLLPENEFFDWSLSKMSEITRLTIVSQTPFMLFEEERKDWERFVSEVENLLDDSKVPTDYFVSSKQITQKKSGISYEELAKKLLEWKRKWESKNFTIYIEKNGFFPKDISIWYGKTKNMEFTLIKIRSASRDGPVWLFEKRNLPSVKELIEKLKNESMTLDEFYDYLGDLLPS